MIPFLADSPNSYIVNILTKIRINDIILTKTSQKKNNNK